jgi:murein DD-endopeptidase MepM/ murein hydrolase activator NlpD
LLSRTGKGIFLAFFFIFLCQPVLYSSPSDANTPEFNFPEIIRLDSRDTGFRQYISDVERNRRRLAGLRSNLDQAAENVTIDQCTVRQGDDLFSIAARCSIPYSALVSLNRLTSPQGLEEGQVILLPSSPGLFVPENPVSDIELIMTGARLDTQPSVELRINTAGRNERFHFFPGLDFTSTERTFFLNPGFRFPLRNYRVTSTFGIRRNPVTGNIGFHEGIDLAAPEGTEVFAIADGVVTEIGDDPIYGIYIIITHQNRLTSLYGHLQRVETTLRSTVRSGTLIGRVGSTGQSTGPHLHFELRHDGRAVDPSVRLRP